MSHDGSQKANPTFSRPVGRRLLVGIMLAITIATGLASRRFQTPLPHVVQKEAGDVLWAMAAYWALAIVFVRWPAWRLAAVAAGLAMLSETSQLCHADWLESLRQYRFAGLLLGSGFSWLDMAMYPAGAVIAWALDRAACRPGKSVAKKTLTLRAVCGVL